MNRFLVLYLRNMFDFFNESVSWLLVVLNLRSWLCLFSVCLVMDFSHWSFNVVWFFMLNFRHNFFCL
jgi:hypothetical protein